LAMGITEESLKEKFSEVCTCTVMYVILRRNHLSYTY
jgi:hypothetical protein